MQRIGFIVFPTFQLMGLSANTVFELVNMAAATPLYEVHILSENGGSVPTSSGLKLETERFDATVFDTLILCAGHVISPSSAGLLNYVKQSVAATRRVASTCTGAFVLGEAGLLDGRRATTHWAYARDLQSRYPKAKVEEDRIFISDGSVWTSAGMTAGIDLALAMVEDDHGLEMSRAIARKLVVFHRRAGGQSQHSALLELEPKSDRIQRALVFAKSNLHNTLSVDQLAEAANLSPRQFSRAFLAETGQSPAKAVENLRVEAARLMIQQGRHSIDVVAQETGFAGRERLRQAFLRAFGQPPQAIRRNARAEAFLQ